jgi:ubiquinone/menaquinone biosynthesis C-methylase UbiE
MDLPPPPPQAQVDAGRLRDMIMGFRVTQMLYVAATLNLPGHLIDGPQSAEEIAARVGADSTSLHRLMRSLTSLGILAEAGGGRFSVTALGRLLAPDAPNSLAGLAILYGDEWLWKAYGRMLHSVRTGETAFAQVHGKALFEFLDTHPDAAAQFQAAMNAYSRLEVSAILDAYTFPEGATVIDVGGGHGTLLAALLTAHPSITGVLFDQPAVVENAERVFADARVSSRATVVGGDFFSELPSRGDLYLLKSVLHNWPDRDAGRILQCCRRAMSPRARLLIAERIVPLGNAPSEAKLFDINMLVVLGGKERTEDEYQELLGSAGFSLVQVIATKSPLSLIEAQPRVD